MSNYQLKDLKKHCFDLAYYFFSLDQIRSDKFSSQYYAYWLHLASSIEEVKLDLGKVGFARGGLIDLTATFYRDAHLKNSQIVNSLVIFNLIWHTFETMLVQDFHQKNASDLLAVQEFLDSEYQPYKNLVHFNDLVGELKRQIRVSRLLDSRILLRGIGQEGRSSVGIILVSRIKNYFAHCAYQFPLGSDPTGPEAIDPLIIGNSSRIVLLTMQMLMLPHFESQSEKSIKCWWDGGEKRRMPVHAFLRTVHLNII
jgi:hypothetical protein